MESVDNFADCLKILESQGFQAEHKLLIQLFGCFETFRNTSVGENLYIPKDIPKTSLIEDMTSLAEEIKDIPKKNLIEDIKDIDNQPTLSKFGG